MNRYAIAAAISSSLTTAPLQCTREPDPQLRREESPGDALFALAERFHAEGNETARIETLKYIVERYPSSRYAPEARRLLDASAEVSGIRDAAIR